jgi:cytidine deaminase
MDGKKTEELIGLALAAKEKAYSPYSRFRVGAALLSESGEIFVGCNVENSSYGLTVCAERVAILKAVSEGVHGFKALALASDAKTPIPPCGACLQVLSEFSRDLEIVSVSRSGERRSWNLKDLIPEAFHFKGNE